MTILRDQLEFIRSPISVVKRMATDPSAAFVGLRNVLAIAVLYEIAILLWAFGADGVTLPAFLRIPEEQYYFYELVFLIPLFLVTWLLASAIAYLMSKMMGGSGTFDAILGGFGLTMAVSAYFTLIPDYVQGVLWTTGWVPFREYQELTGSGVLLLVVWAYLLAYSVAHLFLYSVTIRHTQGLPRNLHKFLGSGIPPSSGMEFSAEQGLASWLWCPFLVRLPFGSHSFVDLAAPTDELHCQEGVFAAGRRWE